MPIEIITAAIDVPGNASRYFKSKSEALNEPEGRVQFAWNPDEPLLFNILFEQGLTSYDFHYYTNVVDLEQVQQIPTVHYFESEISHHLAGADPLIIEIGCGQGEFVQFLESRGFRSVGYDPVLRRTDPPNLHARLWSQEEVPGDLYVMRCVLPHIVQPWQFLDEISDSSPDSLVLVEYQRIEWTVCNSLWAQISHDHVNLFTLEDFTSRYEVLNHGTFLAGEWAYVLFRLSRRNQPVRAEASPLAADLVALVESRSQDLQRLASEDREIVVWGAAGKGTVLVHALWSQGIDVAAVDADPGRWDRFLETSGVVVWPPHKVLDRASSGALVIVANPNHFADVNGFCGDVLDVTTLGSSL